MKQMMKQNTKKKIAMLVLCCMLCTLLPTTALANEPVTFTGGSGTTQTVTNQQLLFAAMADTSVTTIMLDADITIDRRLDVEDRTVTLDLNGYVLKYDSENSNNAIYIGSSGNLTLQDSAPTRTHSGNNADLPIGGVITNSTTPSLGGGVYNRDVFTMNGGTIANCEAYYGAGVYNNEGSFTINGAAIFNCEAVGSGGVYNNAGNFIMNGGNIRDCTAGNYGGGVYNTGDGIFTMNNDARITNCEAAYSGGGVMNWKGTFSMNDNAVITTCKATNDSDGGGVFNYEYNTFIMNGNAKITDCEAYYGGAVENFYGTFTMNDNTTITHCTAHDGGGVGNRGSFTMNDNAEISNCNATRYGGGVFGVSQSAQTTSEFILQNGTIRNCIAEKGSGICLHANADGSSKLYADGGEVYDDVYMMHYSDERNSTITNSADAENVTVFYGDLTKEEGAIIDDHMVTFLLENDDVYAWEVVSDGGTVAKPTAPSGMTTSFDWYNADQVYHFTEKVTSDLTLKIGPAQEYHYSGGGGYYVPEEELNKKDDTVWNNPFTDVSESDWYYNAVKYAHQNKLFAGVSASEFGPNMPMSRGMLVTVLYRLAGNPAVAGDMPFVDVNVNTYYHNAILWAVQNNIISGIADDLFAPDANITREQIAIILYRFAQYCGYDTSVGEDTNILSYDDFNDIHEYAISAMQYAVGSNVMKGRTESTLNPQDSTTRAEIAAMLQRFIEGNK